MPSVVTANRLADGEVVYLGTNGRWTLELAKALLANDGAEEKELMRRAAEDEETSIVVSVYAMAVSVSDGIPLPLSTRERIRAAHGPSPEGLRQTGGDV